MTNRMTRSLEIMVITPRALYCDKRLSAGRSRRLSSFLDLR